jgi:hypothetical protein
MNPQMNETVPDSTNLESCELRFGPGFGMKVASHTVERHDPPFEDIKDLCSDAPLRFYRRPLTRDVEVIVTPEDEADVRDALDALKEPGSVGLDEFKKQLGI